MLNEKIIQKNDEVVPVEAVERKSEYSVVDFDSYETICNFNNDSSRRRGILSEELYKEIVEDPKTVFINSSDSRIPVFMDLNHGIAMGYDAEKCRKYANELSSDIKILTLPFHELGDDERNQTANLIKFNGKCAFYFCDHGDDESKALTETFDKTEIQHIEKPLIDPRAAKGDEQAALYLYSFTTEQDENRGERRKLSLSDVQDYYEKDMEPLYMPDGKTMTTLNIGDRITDQQADEMWDLFNDRFDFLGEGHPISMQDSKEDFFKLLRSDRTMIAATYAREDNNANKLACFTYFIDDMNSLYWLNQKYLSDKFANSSVNQKYTTNIYTPGLVSSGVGASYSSLPLGLFAKACDEAGLSGSIFYENTNLSRKYIPRIVDRAISRACKHMTIKPSEMVDEETYRLWITDDLG